MSLPEDFRRSVEEADAVIASITGELAELPFREGGWSRKLVVGHLIDSALHNHVRFLTAVNTGTLDLKTYDQEACVRLHGYTDMTWPTVTAHWRYANQLLARLVERIPASSYGAPCKLPGGEEVTLEWLIRDYLRHLSHHLSFNQKADTR